MTEPVISFHKAQSSDTEKIVSFHQNPELRNWEDEFHGFIREDGVLFLAKDGDKVIGSQGLLPYRMNIDGVSTLVSRSERTLLSPDYRGLGLFGKIYNECIEYAAERGSKFIFGSTSATKAFDRVGFRSEFSFSLHLVRATGFLKLLRCISKKQLDVDISVSDFIDTLKKRDKWRGLEYVKVLVALPSLVLAFIGSLFSFLGGRGLSVKKDLIAPTDMTELYSKLRGEDSLIYLEQDSAFVNWSERNCGKSHRYFAYRDTTLEGYLVCNFDNPGTVKILDLAASSGAALRTLISAILSDPEVQERGFLKVSFNYRCKPLKKLLLPLIFLGFIPVYRGGNEVLRPLSDEMPEAYSEIENFYITEIWHSLGHEIREE